MTLILFEADQGKMIWQKIWRENFDPKKYFDQKVGEKLFVLKRQLEKGNKMRKLEKGEKGKKLS